MSLKLQRLPAFIPVKYYSPLLVILLLTACSSLPETIPRPPDWATPVPLAHIPNLYRVTGNLYRSAQPDSDGLKEIESLGINTVLNLRYTQTDKYLAAGAGLKRLHYPMLPQAISRQQLRDAVALIDRTPGPVLVHCRHGADRTGAVIAAWRILKQGWSSDKAIDEMIRGGYGHHYWLFPNIRHTLKALTPAASGSMSPS